jgi:hypothetical protein
MNPETTDGPDVDCPDHGGFDGPPLYEWAKLCSTVRGQAVALARHYDHTGWSVGALIHYNAGDPSRAEWVVHAVRAVQA